MKKLAYVFLCVIVCAFMVETGQAQEMMKAKKLENATWHTVVMVKYEPGKMGDAMKIIQDHFVKASEKSGTPGPSAVMEMRSGEWDMMYVWDMDSITDMNWEVTPDDEKWWNAMAEMAGSMESAQKIWQDYLSLVDASTSYLAISRN